MSILQEMGDQATTAVLARWSALLDRYGASLEDCAREVGEAMAAESVRQFCSNGQIFEAPALADRRTRLEAVKIATHGHGVADKHLLDFGGPVVLRWAETQEEAAG